MTACEGRYGREWRYERECMFPGSVGPAARRTTMSWRTIVVWLYVALVEGWRRRKVPEFPC
jgi:hypothetical protein